MELKYYIYTREPADTLHSLRGARLVPDGQPTATYPLSSAILDGTDDWICGLDWTGAGASTTWSYDEMIVDTVHAETRLVGEYDSEMKGMCRLQVVRYVSQVGLQEWLGTMGGIAFMTSALNMGPNIDRMSRYTLVDSRTHYGVACAFQSEGHTRLVSDRWLEHGPWKLHYGKNGTTLVQFYDLDADLDTIMEQVAVSHPRMGVTPEGGFMHPRFPMPEHAPGDYLHDTRTLSVSVLGREVPQMEMLQVATMRRFQLLGSAMPIERLEYVFGDPDEAQAHLHELWLRNIDCITYVNGRRTDLGADYNPQPNPPEWVKRVPTIDLR